MVVIDTNVAVSALRSRHGASNSIFLRLASGHFKTCVSTALMMEYADVLHRPGLISAFSSAQIDEFIDSICAIAAEAVIYFRWRPFLTDPKDDLVFECALAGGADTIITHNVSDFEPCRAFKVLPVTPAEFLKKL